MTSSEKGSVARRAGVFALRWLKNVAMTIMPEKRTEGEIRTAEKGRQKLIRREMRGLSNEPDQAGDRRSQDEKNG
jgi:hypothetical protein